MPCITVFAGRQPIKYSENKSLLQDLSLPHPLPPIIWTSLQPGEHQDSRKERTLREGQSKMRVKDRRADHPHLMETPHTSRMIQREGIFLQCPSCHDWNFNQFSRSSKGELFGKEDDHLDSGSGDCRE